MVKRIQAFEFCDQAWLPSWLREAFHDCLSFVHLANRPYEHFSSHIADWAKKSGAEEVLDLASGGGDHITLLHKVALRKGVSLPRFVVSDLYPNRDDYEVLRAQLGDGVIGYIEKSVSALNVQSDIRHWSMFTAFHHFSPDAARQLLQEFVNKGDAFCIVELTRRTWSDMALMLLGLPLHLLAPFFAKRFTWPKFLFTTIIPIVPLMVAFDGVVSALRSYTKDEIISMLPQGALEGFDIEFKEVWWGLSPLKATLFTLIRRPEAS